MANSRYNPEFGNYLERERLKRGLSIIAFAARLGKSPTYYRQVREGYMPPPETLREMAVAYGVDPRPWLDAARCAGIPLGDSRSDNRPAETVDVPLVGTLTERGVMVVDGSLELSEGTVRYRLRVDADSPGGAWQAGDEVFIEQAQSAERNARVLVEEVDGTRRLLRYIRSAKNGELVVMLLDAAGLQKPLQIEGRIIGILVGTHTPAW